MVATRKRSISLPSVQSLSNTEISCEGRAILAVADLVSFISLFYGRFEGASSWFAQSFW
jgi:hypothetical protein